MDNEPTILRLFILESEVAELTRRDAERSKQLRRAELRLSWLTDSVFLLGGGTYWSVVGYLVFFRHNSFWEWAAIGVGVCGACYFSARAARRRDEELKRNE
jgi:hypothetical protein